MNRRAKPLSGQLRTVYCRKGALPTARSHVMHSCDILNHFSNPTKPIPFYSLVQRYELRFQMPTELFYTLQLPNIFAGHINKIYIFR